MSDSIAHLLHPHQFGFVCNRHLITNCISWKNPDSHPGTLAVRAYFHMPKSVTPYPEYFLTKFWIWRHRGNEQMLINLPTDTAQALGRRPDIRGYIFKWDILQYLRLLFKQFEIPFFDRVL